MFQNYTTLQSLLPAPTASKLCAEPRPHARSIGYKKQSEKACTPDFNGNGFLNHHFLPVLKSYPHELKNWRKFEKDFFQSAKNLCALYGIAIDYHNQSPYPQNIALAFAELNKKMALLDDSLSLKIISIEESLACLTTVKQFDTGMTLFYLPVEPLNTLLADKARKETAELLLSVCAYLYQIGGVPYHEEDSSYLYYIYDNVTEWSSEPEYFEELGQQEVYLNEILQSRKKGLKLLERLKNPVNLKTLKKRQEQFIPKTSAEITLHRIAQRVCTLMNDYPNRSIMDSIYGDQFCKGNDGENIIMADQYISFMWSNSDHLYDQIIECVNAELNEFDSIDEPLSVQFFDLQQDQPVHDLSFEKEFFDLLNEISDNLNDFHNEKYNTTS
ncbi:hypothetical protein SAMN04488511_11483 [Pedobacter suwonensis]|uniref:Uncharacterized protein n=1 Tax=Pedobacter suwonensis TaxID=332999 RepID=A0A1I0TTP2_9SPHI|nr:hypothetical protein [Pedobacter suwonensis]SFA55088.1 hypothetical protein SAMN04488511_11483 [Pedobacter suwonensis]